MSFRVLVIPEDPTNNGYILRPLVSRMLRECEKPNAEITVLTNPKTSGYESAKSLLVNEVIERYAHFDLMLFLPDADGVDKADELEMLEEAASEAGVRLLCCAAVQEVEAWLLAGHLNKLGLGWSEIRAEVDLKESVFEPFIEQYGDARRAGSGRDLLMEETLQNYDGVIQRCPELAILQERICSLLAEG